MYQEERLLAILEFLKNNNRITVEQICELFDISRDTARRDLVRLEEEKSIIRTRGGAILPLAQNQVLSYSNRLKTVSKEKELIGKKAASLISPSDKVILDTSTTVQACAENLDNMDCTVITNSINQAEILSTKQALDIQLLGGTLQKEHRYLYGQSVIEKLSEYHVDKAFIGVVGISEKGLTNAHEEDGEIKHLDGTTLNEESKISQQNLEAIKFAQNKGVEVVIATGRAYFDVEDIFENTGIKTWIIGANGATIHRPNGELYHDIPLDKKDAFEIMSWLEEKEFYYEVFSNHSIYTPQSGRELLAIEIDRAKSANNAVQIEQLEKSAQIQFSQTGFSFINSYKDLLEKDADYYNILAFTFDEEKLQMGRKKFSNRKDLTLVSSAKHNFELEHKDAAKGNALKVLANKLAINIADTAAVGDSYNDLSMLRIAGRSAAMGNAEQEIKDSCHEVTLSNRDDGVAHFIYSLLNKSASAR
uniref:HTH deoR-type domain-containing protein n=1 Tax=Batrachochytrium dendrobatidis (strain JAM81 / FGSC 10211) TaxID=684364 RepID=F4PFM9_BATDJ|eukprot:XP_006683412.1 hypothetical protein BATDEDRAFT_93175 [Batrachochytrium dendrobatidis JAM81]